MKKRAVTKKSKSKTRKPVKKTYTHHPDHYNRSEIFLIDNKAPDLQEAWFKIREFGEAQGPKKIYASGRAIMFSKKVCYFFVRPKKTFLETVVFLSDKKLRDGFSTVRPSTKTKFAHTFKLVHADQVEGALTDALNQAFEETPD